MQDGVLDNVYNGVFQDDGFGLDLHEETADDGGVEDRLSSAFDHSSGDGGR